MSFVENVQREITKRTTQLEAWFSTHAPNPLIQQARKLPAVVLVSVALLAALLTVTVLLSHLLTQLALSTAGALVPQIIPSIMTFCAFAVAVVENPIHALLLLLGLFVSTTALYVALGAEYLALVGLIVYVGALAVLFLFVIMLLNVKSIMSAAQQFIWTPLTKFLVVLGTFAFTTLATNFASGFNKLLLGSSRAVESLVSVTDELLAFVETDAISLGVLYEEHAVLFGVMTALLLLSMLGAIVLAAASAGDKEKKEETQVHTAPVASVAAAAAVVAPATPITPVTVREKEQELPFFMLAIVVSFAIFVLLNLRVVYGLSWALALHCVVAFFVLVVIGILMWLFAEFYAAAYDYDDENAEAEVQRQKSGALMVVPQARAKKEQPQSPPYLR